VAKYYRIVFEEYDSKPEATGQENILSEGVVVAPSNCLDFGIRHEEQMVLIQNAQDNVLKLQADEVTFDSDKCSKCSDGILKKYGFKESWFHDVFRGYPKSPSRRPTTQQCKKKYHG